jgi:acetyl esterase/lipase
VFCVILKVTGLILDMAAEFHSAGAVPHVVVAPDLIDAIAFLPDFGLLSAETLTEIRAQMLTAQPQDLITSPELSVKRLEIPGPVGAPPIEAFLYRPVLSGMPSPALLSIHGGGFVVGAAQREDATMRALVLQSGAAVLSINYRLAPETPFPGPLEDCYSSLRWLHQNACDLGIDASRIAVRGNSAGGGLAAGLCLLARDRCEFPICFQLLIHPMLDDRTGEHPYAGQYVWPVRANRFGWSSYLGSRAGGSDVPVYAAPARATDLAGLPPAFIAVGSIDLFIDEDISYAQSLIRCGVPTELHVYPGAYHGFSAVTESATAASLENSVRVALLRTFRPVVS